MFDYEKYRLEKRFHKNRQGGYFLVTIYNADDRRPIATHFDGDIRNSRHWIHHPEYQIQP